MPDGAGVQVTAGQGAHGDGRGRNGGGDGKRRRPGQLEGQIISIDRFGNLITNITRTHVESLALGQRDSEVIIGKKKILGLSKTYADVSDGKSLTLIGSAGFLEISVNQGNAQKYFNVDRGSKISIRLMKHAQSR